MRKLQIQNMTQNKNQLKKRKDGANQSCVTNEFVAKQPKKKEKRPIAKYVPGIQSSKQFGFPTATSSIPAGQPIFLKGKNCIPEYLAASVTGKGEEYAPYDDEDGEEPTDEARTTEEAYEDIQQFGYSKYPKDRAAHGQGANCVFFNEEGLDEQESGDQSSEEDQEEEEEGEFDPALMGQQNTEGQDGEDDEEDY